MNLTLQRLINPSDGVIFYRKSAKVWRLFYPVQRVLFS